MGKLEKRFNKMIDEFKLETRLNEMIDRLKKEEGYLNTLLETEDSEDIIKVIEEDLATIDIELSVLLRLQKGEKHE